MTERREIRWKQLLDDIKEMRRNWKLKKEALNCTVWRTHFRRHYGPVITQTASSSSSSWNL
jgi:hypothetical protein